MITLHCLIMREHRQGSDNQENPCITPGDRQGAGLELLHGSPWHQDIANYHNMLASHTGDYIYCYAHKSFLSSPLKISFSTVFSFIPLPHCWFPSFPLVPVYFIHIPSLCFCTRSIPPAIEVFVNLILFVLLPDMILRC